MKKFSFCAAALAAVTVAVPSAFASGVIIASSECSDRSPAAVTSPGADAVACQAAVSKGVLKFTKSYLKASSKCWSNQTPGACPSAKDTAKIVKAAQKAIDKLDKKCDTTALAALGSSYAGRTAAEVGSCTLSQVSATGEIFLGLTHGQPGTIKFNVEGYDDCRNTLAKESVKLQASLHKTAAKCIDGALKKGTDPDVCQPSIAAGAVAAAGDVKAGAKMAKALEKALDKVGAACAGDPDYLEDVFACPDANTTAELLDCMQCSSVNSVLDMIDSTYNESGSVITPADTLQASVDAASPGDKLLLTSGEWIEEVTLPSPTCTGGANDGLPCVDGDDCPSGTCDPTVAGLSIVGCGAATGERPRLLPPGGNADDGIFAAGTPDLTFQSLELAGWTNNGIFSANCDNVVYRDILGDGNDLSTGESKTIYAVFPITSDNVLVETSEVFRIRDAGIYVGQTTSSLVRFNTMYDNVTGIEIENSSHSLVHNNYATGNTGGILSFLLTSPERQIHDYHRFAYNVSIANNTPNFAIPGTSVSAVPQGTGFMVISDNYSVFERNIVEDNDSFGFLILDQAIANSLVDPPPFDPTSTDQDVTALTVRFNRVDGNSKNPAPEVPPGFNGQLAFLLGEPADATANGTCFQANSNNRSSAVPANPNIAAWNDGTSSRSDFITCP